ncbi:hypothetical protein LCGC14_1521170, partial [marine sediment metagenome]
MHPNHFIADLGTLSEGMVYVFVTSDAGDVTAGYPILLSAAPPNVVVYQYSTGTGVGWSNAANAWDSTNGTHASRSVPLNRIGTADETSYLLGQGLTGFSGAAGTITKVEIGIEGYVGTSPDWEVDADIQAVFDGVESTDVNMIGGEDLLTSSASTAIHYVNVTNDSGAPGTWTFADVEKLDAKVWGENYHTSNPYSLFIDQIYVRVTYYPVDISISDIEDENFIHGETGVIITGNSFIYKKGTGKVELASSSDYATATKVQQTTTSWTDTSIDFTVDIGALTEGTLYVFVTNNDAQRTAGWPVTVTAAGKTWAGGDAGGPTNWSNSNNWNPGGVPGPGDNVLIPATANDPVVDAAAQSKNLTVATGETLTVSGGSLDVSGNLTIEGTVDVNAQPVTVSGNVTGSGHLDASGSTFDISIVGSITVSQYTATSGTTRVGANWDIVTFTHNTGTVQFFTSGDSAIYGNNNFNNLTSVIPGKTLKIEGGTVQSAANFTITGA